MSKKEFQPPSQIFHIIYYDHANVCMPKGELGVCGQWVLVQANESIHYWIEYKDIQMLIWFRPECRFPYYYPNVFLRLRLYSRWLLFYTLLYHNMLHVIIQHFFNLSFYTMVKKNRHWIKRDNSFQRKTKAEMLLCIFADTSPLTDEMWFK